MALGIWIPCPCGTHIRAYIPKEILFGPISGKTVNWKAIDNREEAEGAVREIKDFAKKMGQTFIDLRESKRVHCPTCEKELDVQSTFHQWMFGLRKAS